MAGKPVRIHIAYNVERYDDNLITWGDATMSLSKRITSTEDKDDIREFLKQQVREKVRINSLVIVSWQYLE